MANPRPAFGALLDAAKAATITDPAKALPLVRQAEVAADAMEASKRPLAIASAERLRGEAYVKMDRFDDALAVLEPALKSARQTARGGAVEADILLSMGSANGGKGELAQAFRNYEASFAIYQRLGDVHNQAAVLLNIGALYGDANDYASVLKYLDQAISLRGGDPSLLPFIYFNRGSSLQDLGRYREAEASYRKALVGARGMNSPLLRARILGNIARVRLSLHDEPGASALLRQAMALTASGDAAAWRPQLVAIAAQAAYQRGDYPAAARLIGQRFAGVDLATTAITFRSAHETAYETYRALGDVPRALAHLAALKRLDDQATRLATSANAALASAQFDSDNQKLRIIALQRDEATRAAGYERQRAHTERMIFLGAAAAAAALVGLLAIWLTSLRRSNNRVRAAAADLANSNTALGKALAAKTEFLATTSHEIRTPLNGILGMTQVMLADNRLAEDVRDRISVVHGAGVTMRALVDDILDVAKMETGHLSVERVPVDLPATLNEAARMWDEQARAKGLSFTLDLTGAPVMIEGDAGRLRQIVLNLLSNAVKFTAEGNVSLTARRAGDLLELVVADTGIGIAADKRELIFESFRQADTSTTRQFGGTGLGLAICRNLSRAMNGDVGVESEPGRGAVFTVTLPLVELAQAAGDEPVAADPQVAPTLVVDANPIGRAMLRTMIAARDPAVIACASLAEAKGMAAGRIVVDQSAFAAADSMGDLASLATTAAIWVLWKGDAPAEIADHATLVAKPIAGPALVETIFTSSCQGWTDPALARDAA